MMKNNQAIVFDYSNLCMRCLHLPMIGADTPLPAWDLLEYLIFDKMFEFLFTSGEPDTDVILAMDSPGSYWRRDIYAPYKADRAARRESSGIDYKEAFSHFGALAESIRAYLPWKVIRVDKCEADDVIYTVAKSYTGTVTVHSADSDYIQLLSMPNVQLFRPNDGCWFSFPYKGMKTPQEFLAMAILTGQGGKDNVYNVRTPTGWTKEHGRKPPFGEKMAWKFIDHGTVSELELEEAGILENYARNRMLIDMSCLPGEYEDAIRSELQAQEGKPLLIDDFLDAHAWPSYSIGTDRRTDAVNVLALMSGEEYSPPVAEWEEPVEKEEMLFTL